MIQRVRNDVRIGALPTSAALVLGLCACTHARPAERSTALENALRGRTAPFASSGNGAPAIWRDEQRFYQQNDYRLIWIDGRRPGPAMAALVRALRASDEEGLDPRRYGVDAIDSLRRSFDPTHAADAADIDIRCTWAYLRYAWDLTHGATAPQDIDPQWRS